MASAALIADLNLSRSANPVIAAAANLAVAVRRRDPDVDPGVTEIHGPFRAVGIAQPAAILSAGRDEYGCNCVRFFVSDGSLAH